MSDHAFVWLMGVLVSYGFFFNKEDKSTTLKNFVVVILITIAWPALAGTWIREIVEEWKRGRK